MKKNSKSFGIAKQFLGKEVEVVIDRPLGSRHPEFDFVYEVNYGYVAGVKMPDGDDLDAYCLGWSKPQSICRGKVIAVIHRFDDDDDKLVVAASGLSPAIDIEREIAFQEKWFKGAVIR